MKVRIKKKIHIYEYICIYTRARQKNNKEKKNLLPKKRKFYDGTDLVGEAIQLKLREYSTA